MSDHRRPLFILLFNVRPWNSWILFLQNTNSVPTMLICSQRYQEDIWGTNGVFKVFINWSKNTCFDEVDHSAFRNIIQNPPKDQIIHWMGIVKVWPVKSHYVSVLLPFPFSLRARLRSETLVWGRGSDSQQTHWKENPNQHQASRTFTADTRDKTWIFLLLRWNLCKRLTLWSVMGPQGSRGPAAPAQMWCAC